MNPFKRETDEYVRQSASIEEYVLQASTYLAKMNNLTMEASTAVVRRIIAKGRKHAPVDPVVLSLVKKPNGDRVKEVSPLSEIRARILAENRIVSPTGSEYIDQNKEMSVLSEYIAGNVKNRGMKKKEKFVHEQEAGTHKRNNDPVAEANSWRLSQVAQVVQVSLKVKNNSLSGAHGSSGTILFLASAHSALTSTCRSVTSYANSFNEKFLAGNRHYYSADVAIHNITALLTHSNYEEMVIANSMFKLNPPTVKQLTDHILRSLRLYVNDPKGEVSIHRLVSNMTDLERMAVGFSNDGWLMIQCNPDVMRDLLGSMVELPDTPVADEEYWWNQLDGDMEPYISYMRSTELNRTQPKTVYHSNLKGRCELLRTIKQTCDTLTRFKPFIEAYWRTDHLPCNMAQFPTSRRRAVAVSDTDSTIFTTQDWIRWYYGGNDPRTEEADKIESCIVYMISLSTVHTLAQVSKNMGVRMESLHKLSMKNEFMFPVLLLASKAKHYASRITACEGTVYESPHLELKGVTLKTSNVPKFVKDKMIEIINRVFDYVMDGRKINLGSILKEVADMERDIFASMRNSDRTYLRQGDINTKESYSLPETSSYRHFELWNEMWGNTYGAAPEPPYRFVSVSTTLSSKTALKRWIAGMKNRKLASDIERTVTARNMKDLKTMKLPMEILPDGKIPEEILSVMDMRKLVYSSCEGIYLVLETLGVYIHDKNNIKLVSDQC